MKLLAFWIGAFITKSTAGAECDRSSPLELYILQDGTSSFSSFVPNARIAMKSLAGALEKEFASFKVGVGIFGDKTSLTSKSAAPNIMPCFKQIQDVTSDRDSFTSAMDQMAVLTSGGDIPEDQFEIMAYAAGSAAGFSSDPARTRILVVITDATSHAGAVNVKAPNSNLEDNLICNGIKYPPISQVKDILQKHDVHPLILLAGKTSSTDVWKTWERDMKTLGFPTTSIQGISMDVSGLVKSIVDSVKVLDCEIEAEKPLAGPSIPDTTTLPATTTAATTTTATTSTTTATTTTTTATKTTTTTTTTSTTASTTTAMTSTTLLRTTTASSTETNSDTAETESTSEGTDSRDAGAYADFMPVPAEGEGRATNAIVIGAAAGGVAVLAAAGAYAGVTFLGSQPAPAQIEMAPEGPQGEEVAAREAYETTTSRDYGAI